ncbi:MAG: hypothetical protein IKK44_00960, partial [Clostridium sp.]|nr:hypothetical protein [Clostridium sp.]
MESLFLTVLNMDITASYVILAILVVRLLLHKAPKAYSYALWSAAAFRLVCPVSFQSAVSLFSAGLFDMTAAQAQSGHVLTYVPDHIGMMTDPQVTVGIPQANAVLSASLPDSTPMYSANPMQIWIFLGASVWCIGLAALLLSSVVSYLFLAHRMNGAVLLEENVYQSEGVRSPFILGFFRPRIYIPFGMEGEELEYVLAHERFHLKRLDHLVKPLAFLILALHWFNPLVWLAFALMTRDMEMSCDEKVLSQKENIRKAYSTTLLSFAAGRRFPAPCPLSFGESGVKRRIKNALNWKKPKVWVTLTAAAVCAASVTACAANPRENLSMASFEQLYQTDLIVYQSPYLSMFYTAPPAYLLTEDQVLMKKVNGSWTELGQMSTEELSTFSFAPHFYSSTDVSGWRKDADLPTLLRESRFTLVLTSGKAVYCALLLEDGSVYLGQGRIGNSEPEVINLTWMSTMTPAGPEAMENDPPEYLGDPSKTITPLSQEQIDEVNAAFADPLTYHAGKMIANPVHCFFTSYYGHPDQINLAEFLRYFPYSSEVTEETEFAALKQLENWPFGADITLEEMYVPIHKYSANVVEEVLWKYAGILLDDLSGVGMDTLCYLEEYDAYYNFTSDAGGGTFQCVRGEIQGDVVRLYEEVGGDMLYLTKS